MKALQIDNVNRSVVQLLIVSRAPNYYQPWESSWQRTSTGTGCIIAGHRILTNAHVVEHHLLVQVVRPWDPTKYIARVIVIDHDTETALLTVDDPSFFEGTLPVVMGTLPSRNDPVTVYGFPAGGRELCATSGIVSRIEVITYTHSRRDLIAIQVDAAINPGNSGGPVIKDGLTVGIVFQRDRGPDIERAGYVIPSSVIGHMLCDLENETIDGVPDLGVFWQKIENPSLRSYLNMTSRQAGVMVTRVVSGSSADGLLQEGDVITEIDGQEISCDGSVTLRGDERVMFSHLVNEKQVGAAIALEFLRRGKRLEVDIPLRGYTALVPHRHRGMPKYIVFAGLVITPVTLDFMKTWRPSEIHFRLQYWYNECLPSVHCNEIVIIAHVLAHKSNVGYHHIRCAQILKVNRVSVARIEDVVRGLQQPLGDVHVIEIDYLGPRSQPIEHHATYGTRVVIDAASVMEANAEICAQNNIAFDRSPELR